MTDAKKLAVCLANSNAFDGIFYYAVKTTGIFCRPSCPSKAPLVKNILFFDSAEEAMAANFRPCKRCRPDLSAYSPSKGLAEKAKAIVDKSLESDSAFAQALLEIGASKGRLEAVFKEQYSMSINEYRNEKRVECAAEMLAKTQAPIVDIAYASGFESLSSFYRIFGKIMDNSPAAYRKDYKKGALK